MSALMCVAKVALVAFERPRFPDVAVCFHSALAVVKKNVSTVPYRDITVNNKMLTLYTSHTSCVAHVLPSSIPGWVEHFLITKRCYNDTRQSEKMAQSGLKVDAVGR